MPPHPTHASPSNSCLPIQLMPPHPTHASPSNSCLPIQLMPLHPHPFLHFTISANNFHPPSILPAHTPDLLFIEDFHSEEVLVPLLLHQHHPPERSSSQGSYPLKVIKLRGVLWCGVVWCGVVWCGVVWCGVVWCGVVWCGVVWCGVVWCGVVWCGVVWCGVVWCGVVWWNV